MSTLKQRQELRRKELMERLNNLGMIGLLTNYKSTDYIKLGGNIDEVCREIQEDHFHHNITDFYNIRTNNFGTSEEFLKKLALEEYIFRNKDNIHKIYSEIPWSLKNTVDYYFAK